MKENNYWPRWGEKKILYIVWDIRIVILDNSVEVLQTKVIQSKDWITMWSYNSTTECLPKGDWNKYAEQMSVLPWLLQHYL
jgi:hypothetical protein